MLEKPCPLFLTLRFFDEDWAMIDEAEMRNVPFKQGIKIMEQFLREIDGDCSPLAMTEEFGRPIQYVTGEVTLGKV